MCLPKLVMLKLISISLWHIQVSDHSFCRKDQTRPAGHKTQITVHSAMAQTFWWVEVCDRWAYQIWTGPKGWTLRNCFSFKIIFEKFKEHWYVNKFRDIQRAKENIAKTPRQRASQSNCLRKTLQEDFILESSCWLTDDRCSFCKRGVAINFSESF